MDDNLLVPPGRRPTRYRWLKENFEDRTVAEMSVWFCIAATGSFIVAVLFLPVLGGICGLAGVSVELIVWLGSLAWLARSFVRIARGWGSDRLGAETFAAMQRVFLVMTALTMLAHGVYFEQFRVFLYMLVGFDVIILEMIVVFLLLAWFARCPVPWRTYGQIGAVALLFVLQVVLLM
ncbi:MAG TPA: hypothetical protein PK316_07840 [Sedimentisphaerales bacterium]|jgi:hypothetical protein|nr:hypothetical protein [Sedimentisphaerales bacterium]